MYKVLKLFAVHRSSIDVFTPEEKSPQEFQQLADMETTLYILISAPNNIYGKVGIAYGRLITDHSIGLQPTWDLFCKKITLEILLGYSELIPGYGYQHDSPENPMVIWDVMHLTDTFNTNYADYVTETTGLFPFRHTLKDLVITLQDNNNTTKPDFKNCVPIVNGYICRPILKDNKLYALDGSHLSWNTGPHLTPEVLLLDFQHIGDMTTHSMYIDKFPERSFSVSFCNRQDRLSLDSDWLLTSQYSLYEYTPIVSIMGLLIFPDRIELTSEYSFRVKVQDIPFNKALAMRSFYTVDTNSPSEVSYGTEDPLEYLQRELTQETYNPSKDTFVILIKNPRIFVSRFGTDVWRNGVTVDIYTEEGLLIHDPTQRVLAYHCSTFSDRKELTLQNSHTYLMADNPFISKQLGFIKPDCKHQDFQDLFQGNATLLSVMGG